MIIQKYNDYQINKYRKAMKIVDVFQKNMKNGKETRVIIKSPGYVINGTIALLLKIKIDDVSIHSIPEIMAEIQIPINTDISYHTRRVCTKYVCREISVYDLELFEEKENTEMKKEIIDNINSVYGLSSEGFRIKLEKTTSFDALCKDYFTPKRINFRKKNGAYYTDVLWKDGTVTVVKLKEGDNFDEYTAFCAAFAKKVFGSTNAVNTVVKKTACYPLSKSAKKIIGKIKKANKECKGNGKTC